MLISVRASFVKALLGLGFWVVNLRGFVRIAGCTVAESEAPLAASLVIPVVRSCFVRPSVADLCTIIFVGDVKIVH